MLLNIKEAWVLPMLLIVRCLSNRVACLLVCHCDLYIWSQEARIKDGSDI